MFWSDCHTVPFLPDAAQEKKTDISGGDRKKTNLVGKVVLFLMFSEKVVFIQVHDSPPKGPEAVDEAAYSCFY